MKEAVGSGGGQVEAGAERVQLWVISNNHAGRQRGSRAAVSTPLSLSLYEYSQGSFE